MDESTSYSVLAGGEILPGFEFDQVRDHFARLFKVSPEKAAAVLKSSRVLKKELDLATAEKYRQKLESIGLAVTVKKHEKPFVTSSGMTLALEPIEGEKTQSQEDGVVVEPPSAPVSPECPKCGHALTGNAAQCEACGFRINQATPPVMAASAAATVSGLVGTAAGPEPVAETADWPVDVVVADEGISLRIALAGAVAALLGALIWYGIAMATDYEVGYVAWGVGAVIGITVTAVGGHGNRAGYVAAALAIVAIVGGKCLIASHFKDQLSATLLSSQLRPKMKKAYQNDMAAASSYADDVYDDDSLRQFMVKYHYGDEDTPKGITSQEIARFNRNVKPRLVHFADTPPTFDQWYQTVFQSQLDNISSLDMVERSLGIKDFVFLALGLFTAYRFGRGFGRR